MEIVSPQNQNGQPAPPVLSAEDQKFRTKFVETKNEVEQLEQSNARLFARVHNAKKILERLKFERRLLLEKLESINPSLLSSNGVDYDDEQHPIDVTNTSTAPITGVSFNTSFGHGEDTADDTDAASTVHLPLSTSDDSKRKRKKRDPKAPKKPKNAFFLFCQRERDKVKQANPDISRAEMTRTLGAQWKELSEGDKRRFYDLYEKEKVRYATELAFYEGGTGVVSAAENSGDKVSVPATIASDEIDDVDIQDVEVDDDDEDLEEEEEEDIESDV